MTPEQKEQLENEEFKGAAAERVYNAYIKDFCEQKRMALFMSFSNLPLTAEDQIMETKRMLYAIDTLEEEIISEIDTGKMASQALSKLKETQH
jgi:hypothetical protein